jgi:hypothetical protein
MYVPFRGTVDGVNPFRYQGPASPERLIDRRGALADLQHAAANRVAIRLAAPRRFGKTTVLGAHVETMRAVGHRAVIVDFSRVTRFADAVVRLTAAYTALPPDPTGTVAKWAKRVGLGVNAGVVTASFGSAPDLPASDAQAAIAELLDLPARLHAADGGLTVVCFDEFQDVLVASDGLDGLFRSVLQHQRDAASYVYAGSEPSLMRALFTDRERPFYGQARPLELPGLPHGEAVEDIERAFAEAGHAAPTGLVGALVAFTDGHPQRTMLIAHHLFEQLERQAATPLDAALDATLREVADALSATWDGFGRLEQVLLTALAEGQAPTGTRVAEEHRLPRSSLANALRRMVDDGQTVARPEGAGPTLVDPLLGEWIRRRNLLG